MKWTASLTVSGATSARKSDVRQGLKKGFLAAGWLWFRRYRARHFAMTAFDEYGYAKRNTRYTLWKMRHLKHSLPLVRTGKSRDLTRNKTIMATSKYVHVRMSARTFNWKPKGFKGNMATEMTTISAAEHQSMADIAESNFAGHIRKCPPRKIKG